MNINELINTLTSIKTLIGAIIDERDRQKLAAIQLDLTDKIIEAKTQLSEVLNTVIEQQRLIPILEQRIRELEAAKAEKERYRLTKVGSVGEFMAYALCVPTETSEGVSEPFHFLCQPCFDAGKKSILVGNGEGYWRCPVCKVGAQTTPAATGMMSTGPRISFDRF